MLIVRTPDGRLTWLQAIASRRKAAVAAGIPAAFAGWLITDGYTGYQHLLSRLAGIQQCCAHVIRRCRAVAKLGPGGGACGRSVLRAGAERRGGAAVVLRECAVGAGRAAHRHAPRYGGLARVGR